MTDPSLRRPLTVVAVGTALAIFALIGLSHVFDLERFEAKRMLWIGALSSVSGVVVAHLLLRLRRR